MPDPGSSQNGSKNKTEDGVILPGGNWNPANWVLSFLGFNNYFGGLGGDIGSGIEGGIVAFFKDIWAVILPFMEIGVGMAIAFWAIAVWLMSTHAGQAAIGTAFKAAAL